MNSFRLFCSIRSTSPVFAAAAAILATTLLSAALPAQACRAVSRLNPAAEAHFLEFADKSVRFASNRMELNEDDMLFIRLPRKNTSVETGNGDTTLNFIRDISVLDSARFTEIAPPGLINAANLVLQRRKQGDIWFAFQAMRGSTTLTVDIEGKKSALNVTVKPYVPPAPEPINVPLEKATQDKPFGMRAGQEFEINLPGHLAEGWVIDIPKNSGVTVKSLTLAKPANGTSTSSQPMVRMLFDVSGGGSPINIPQRISIKRGGTFSGEAFDLYLVFYPIPTC